MYNEPTIYNNILIRDISSWKSRKATIGLLRHDLTKNLQKTSSGYPIVKAYNLEFPEDLIDISHLSKCTQPNQWLNCFSEDIVLERIWSNPVKYLNAIPLGGGLIAPDFSLKLDMTTPEKQINIFRRNAIAAIAQSANIKTIIPLSWAEYASLEYCFEGIEPEGIYAISNIGVQRDYLSRKFFRVGLTEAIRILNPKGLLVYGYPLENCYGIECRLYKKPNIERLRQINNRALSA